MTSLEIFATLACAKFPNYNKLKAEISRWTRAKTVSVDYFIYFTYIDFVQFMEDKSDSLKQSMDLSVIGYEEEDTTVQGTYKIL